jgi:hypothetical protein
MCNFCFIFDAYTTLSLSPACSITSGEEPALTGTANLLGGRVIGVPVIIWMEIRSNITDCCV